MKKRTRHNPSSTKRPLHTNSENTYTYTLNAFIKRGLKMLMPSVSVVILLFVSVVVLFIVSASEHVASSIGSLNDGKIASNAEALLTESQNILREDEYTLPEYDYKYDYRNILADTDPSRLLEDKSTLTYKTTDERVRTMQERLIELGYLHIDESTTYFGPATKAAVYAFQRQHNLKTTGNANTKTLKLMFSDKAEEYCLREGDRGDDITRFQDLLCDLAYIDKRTGYYGSDTTEAVKSFQKNNELAVTGVADLETVNMLYNPNAKPSDKYQKQEKRRAKIQLFVEIVKAQLGKRYSIGATGPNSFDCSGLVYYCLRQAGSSRRRLTAAGYSQVTEWEKITSVNNLEIGDLLFFYSSSAHTRIGHVGVYVGGGMMIDASTSSGRIIRQPFRTSYWNRLYAFARRPW